MNNSVKYVHACMQNTQCKCGWLGCYCKLGYTTTKAKNGSLAMNSHCPECKNIVTVSTVTTSPI